MKRYKIVIVVAAFAAGVLASCRLIPQIVLFNHSGEDITVQQADRTYVVDNGEVRTFQFPGSTTDTVAISTGKQKWTYPRLPYPPSEFCQPVGRERIKIQIEPDGMLYVLAHTNRFPLPDLSGQPNGFPIKPEKKPNTTSEGIRRPADGSPKPSM